MCGILLAQSFDKSAVNTKVLERFESQRYRGTQGFGLYDGRELNLVRSTTEDKIKAFVNKYPTDMLLFHHRFPTSTDNVKNACHPFTTGDFFGQTQYVFIHNGHISNASERKAAHEGMGITYYSIQPDGRFNDSEALAWDIALYLEGRIEAVEANGSAAYIVLKRIGNRIDTVYFGRNSNPLKVDWTTKGLLLASQGEGWDAEPGVLYAFDPLSHTLRVGTLVIPRDIPTYSYTSPSKTTPAYQPDTFAELKRKYGKKRARAIIAARTRGNGFTPAVTVKKTSPTLIGEIVSNQTPTPNHIKDEVKKYLKLAKGKFEDAFWLCQLELDRCQEDLSENSTNIVRRTDLRVAEGVMEVLVTDPEWNTPKAISSLVSTERNERKR